MNKAEITKHNFESGFNCAQSVLAAFAEDFGMPREMALKIASAFGGGIKMARTCGGITGALMALGLARGYSETDEDKKEASDRLALEFLERWREEIGPTDCKDILGYDVSDPVQKEAAVDAGITDKHCPNCIATAAQIVVDLLSTGK